MTGGDPTDSAEVVRVAVRANGHAELCWSGPDGRPRWAVVTPLLADGAVVLALTYAERELAHDVAAAGAVALVLPGPDGSTVLTGRVTLADDPRGARFVDTSLLAQHLAKHPPSRALADSVMLRREHWWYVPRLLLQVDVQAVHPLPGRRDARTDPLVLLSGPSRDASPEVGSGTRPVPRVHVSGAPAPGPDGTAALLVGHDASDDLERTVRLQVPGRVVDGAFVPDDPPLPVLPPLPDPPGLMARWSRQRALRRACVEGLRAAGLA